MIHPKIIMGYKATPHKIVRNIDGEWYELKPHFYGWDEDLKPGQKPLSAYYWHIGEPEPTFHEYKHVDGILKYVKPTYKELPFQEKR